jgi:membrane-associated protein
MIEFFWQILRDPGLLITWGGYPGLALVIFLETGALCFFLPGDSLLVLAGFYAAKGDLGIIWLNAILIFMAIFGDACSYTLGRFFRKTMVDGSKMKWIRPEHIEKTQAFYQRHGGKAIVLARFVPVVRTFIPVVAGMAEMRYVRFAFYNMFGGFLWVFSLTITGYFLGWRFPALLMHVEKVVWAVVALSVLPAIWEYRKH